MSRVSHARLWLAGSLVLVLAAGAYVSAQRQAATMVTAANAFLASLTPEQRAQATFELTSNERLRWNFIPDEAFPRKGVQMKALNAQQRKLAHDLLKTGLSQKGYATYNGIMELESILKVIEEEERSRRGAAPPAARGGAPRAGGLAPTGVPGAAGPGAGGQARGGRAGGGPGGPGGAGGFVRDPLHHRVSIFGTLGPDTVWGWRLEGHHVSLHYTVSKGQLLRAAPTFAGTNPAEVRSGKQKLGLRLLGEQEDAARAFLTSLPADLQQTAIINATAPNEILTNNRNDISPLAQEGIQARALSAEQRLQLLNVVRAFSGLMADEIANERLGRIYSAGVENLWFAWAGGVEKGQRHYFRIQGPTFLIEFDNSQNDGNHVHSVWRDFQGDFGRDILGEHLAQDHGLVEAVTAAR